MAIIQLSLWCDKVCRICAAAKPVTEFYRSPANKDGLRSYCKECSHRLTLEWQHNNAERHRERARIYRHKNPQVSAESARRQHAKKPEYYKAYFSEYRKKHPRRYADYQLIRFHRIRSNGGSFTQEEWDALCAEFGFRCACCGKKTKLTVDHVVPVTKGGTSDIANVQPLCRPCNSRKGDKAIDYRTQELDA